MRRNRQHIPQRARDDPRAGRHLENAPRVASGDPPRHLGGIVDKDDWSEALIVVLRDIAYEGGYVVGHATPFVLPGDYSAALWVGLHPTAATPDDTSPNFLSSEFGSRHAQYEKFYGGPSFIAKRNLYRNFDFKRATGLVDKALNLPAVE